MAFGVLETQSMQVTGEHSLSFLRNSTLLCSFSM
jgi:hypothetical protein